MRKGWNTKRLVELCEVFTDGDWIETKDQSPEGIRLIQTGNVGKGQFKDRRDKARFIDRDTFDRLNCTEIYEGDCLISRLPDPVGRACLLPSLAGRQITAVDCTIARFKPEVLPEFIAYYFQSSRYLMDVDRLCTGATRKRISRKKLGSVEIPLPPLAEQKRIVAILDEAFEAIESNRRRYEVNAKDGLAVFDAALRTCFDQTLEAPKWMSDTSRPMADQLFDLDNSAASGTRGRQATDRVVVGDLSLSVNMPPDSPRDGWSWRPLTELARLESGHTPSRRHPEYWDGDVPWIGIKDAKAYHGSIIRTTQQHTNQLGLDNSASRLLPAGTVCLSRTASVGYVVVMGCPMATSQDFVNWVCGPGIDPNYLKYLLVAEGEGFSRYSSGAVHQTIYFPEVKAFHACVPDVNTQRRIVAFLDALYPETQRLVSLAQRRVDFLEDLKQSLLSSTFAGTLTADCADDAVAEAIA